MITRSREETQVRIHCSSPSTTPESGGSPIRHVIDPAKQQHLMSQGKWGLRPCHIMRILSNVRDHVPTGNRWSSSRVSGQEKPITITKAIGNRGWATTRPSTRLIAVTVCTRPCCTAYQMDEAWVPTTVCITSMSRLGVTEQGAKGQSGSHSLDINSGTISSSGIEGELDFLVGISTLCLWTQINPKGYLSCGVIRRFGSPEKGEGASDIAIRPSES
jgi:hypothetical protein